MKWLREWSWVLLLLALLVGANFLPPDTSLREVRRTQTLTVCVPDLLSPLVTQDPNRPGIDIELLQAVAQEMNLRLNVNRISAMGRDLNPRNWRITRAQCQVVAGGIIDAPSTRGFLAVTPSYARSSWALVVPADLPNLKGLQVAVYPGLASLDRVLLGRFLREQGAVAQVVASGEELRQGLATGRYRAGIAEGFVARETAAFIGWSAQSLPLGEFSLVFGLWKGDLTLKRALVQALRKVEQSGGFAKALNQYRLASLDPNCGVCTKP